MLLLGVDLGTSSIKVSVVDQETQQTLVTVNYPEQETPILSPEKGWAEQDPDLWWEHICFAVQKAHQQGKYDPKAIGCIGIAYQMHGLVLLDRAGEVLRNAIIWCDSRAVGIGQKAFEQLGEQAILRSHLNSPGNFTASKLKWVKDNEAEVYEKVKWMLLPGDYVSYKLTGEVNTTISALSEGILWDFSQNKLSATVIDHYGLNMELIPPIHPVFHDHGKIIPEVAGKLGLSGEVRVTYKAGDQPNNALSLQALNPGEVAATAGTSGVIYGVSDQLIYDGQSRINSFAHVNYTAEQPRIGVLLCINGTGIMNSWTKQIAGAALSYTEINQLASQSPIGSRGLYTLPFGNGAERMLNDRVLQASLSGIDLNQHGRPELFRSAQEGIAFAFRFGLDIMRENGMSPTLIRAGQANMFLSPVFREAFVCTTGVPLELYHQDGSAGAALGAGIGAGVYQNPKEAFNQLTCAAVVEPQPAVTAQYDELYSHWKHLLLQKINTLS